MRTSTIIGIVAVTLMVVILVGGVALFNALESGHLGSLFRLHTVMMLDKSVELVERYRSSEGRYPETLARARPYLKAGEVYPDLDFMGPLKFGERVRHLYYEPGGNGKDFFLFGVGLDDKPFTGDDVYPTNSATDKSDGFKKPEIRA